MSFGVLFIDWGIWRRGRVGGPDIRGTQVKSSGNKNRMNPSRSSNGAYFSGTPMSWHIRPPYSLIAIMNY